MAAKTEQRFENHVKVPRLFLVQVVGYVVAAALAILGLVFTGTIVGTCLIGSGLLLVAALTVSLTIKARIYALTVQDRIIRLEMQLRLERVLPDDLKEAARNLTLNQLIALRFASDPELPDLVREIAEGRLSEAREIKRAVKDWQADHQRV